LQHVLIVQITMRDAMIAAPQPSFLPNQRKEDEGFKEPPKRRATPRLAIRRSQRVIRMSQAQTLPIRTPPRRRAWNQQI
jgi:hypothetical protein